MLYICGGGNDDDDDDDDDNDDDDDYYYYYVIFCQCFIYLFIFYGRLILRPWLTEVREIFTRGGP